MEFLEGGLLKLMSSIKNGGALRTITNMVEEYNLYGKLKK